MDRNRKWRRLEATLLGLVNQAWETYHRDGRIPKAVPDTEQVWELIRLARFADQHGLGRLTSAQRKRLRAVAEDPSRVLEEEPWSET